MLDTAADRTLVIPRDHYASDSSANSVGFAYRPSYQSGDLNNDGYADFCYYRPTQGLLCTLHEGSSAAYGAITQWSEDLGYKAEAEDYKYYTNFSLLDLNNDSYADYCITDSQGVRCGLNNKAGGFHSASYWYTFTTNSSDKDDILLPTFVEIDSDKSPDMCMIEYDMSWKDQGITHENYKCFKNTGAGFTQEIVSLSGQLDVLAPFAANAENCETDWAVACEAEHMITPFWTDVDGDIDSDLCWIKQHADKRNTFTCSIKSTHPTTKAFEYSTPKDLAVINHRIDQNGEDSDFKLSFRTGDLNGDGLMDICYIRNDANAADKYQCQLNTGSGFTAAQNWLDVSYITSFEDRKTATLSSIAIQDMNMDGLADFCAIYDGFQHCAYNQSGQFSELTPRQVISADIDTDNESIKAYANFVRKLFNAKTTYTFSSSNAAFGKILSVTDVNRDGFTDSCYRSIQGVMCVTNNNFEHNALLTSITDSFGQRTDIAFANTLDGQIYQAAAQIPQGFYESPKNIKVVASITTDSGVEQNGKPLRNTLHYRYEGYLTNPGLNISGFSAIEVEDKDRGTRSRSTLYLSKHLQGLEQSISDYLGGTLVKEKHNSYSANTKADGSVVIALNQTREIQNDITGSWISTTTSDYFGLDHYNHPATIVVDKQQGAERLITTTSTTYDHDETRWIIGRPKLQSTESDNRKGSSITRDVSYQYDSGKLIGQVIAPQSSNALTTDYSYDGLGNIIQTTVSGSGQTRTVTKTFDQLGRVLTEKNPLGDTQTYTYDNHCGLVATETNARGLTTKYAYDALCRVVKVDTPDSNDLTKTYAWATAEDDVWVGGYPFEYENPLLYTVTEQSAQGLFKKTFHDAAGRTIKTQASGFSDTRMVRTSSAITVFDRYGRKTATTQPYYAYEGSASESPEWIILTYDLTGRPVLETKTGPNGLPMQVQYQYSGLSTTITHDTYSKTTVQGIHGKPNQITENGLSISFTYDALGNVLSTTNDNLVTHLIYDDRGNKIQQYDPSMGRWHYSYNAFGELTEQTDAKQQTIRFEHDALGRKIKKAAPEGNTIWTYGASGHTTGLLVKEVTPLITKTFNYTALGLIESESVTIDGEIHTTSFAYDSYSRLVRKTDPSGMAFHYSYGTTGLLDRVQVPAEDFKDFNFDQLDAEYTAILTEIARVSEDIVDLQIKRDMHYMRAMEYQNQVHYFTKLKDQVDQKIGDLAAAAAHHEQLAETYNTAASDARALKDELFRQHGSRRFSYNGIKDGKYDFSYKTCTKKKRRWGVGPKYCKKYAHGDAQIPIGELNPGGPSVKHDLDEGKFWFGGYQPYKIYEHTEKLWSEMAESAKAHAKGLRDEINFNNTEWVWMPRQVTEDTFIPIAGAVTFVFPQPITYMKYMNVQVTRQEASNYYGQKIDEAKANYQKAMADYESLNQGTDNFEGLNKLYDDITSLYAEKDTFEQNLAQAGFDAEDLSDAAELNEVLEAKNGLLTVWQATFRNAKGQVQRELFGNGLRTIKRFNSAGLVDRITTDSYTDQALRDIHYTYDSRGQIIEKKDDQTTGFATAETFGYDNQGRLIQWDYSQSVTVEEDTDLHQLHRTYDYDVRGNMTFKTGAGDMQYHEATNRLMVRNNGIGQIDYLYDENGNMTSGDDRTYTWTSFNKVKSILMNGIEVQFSYDAQNRRIKKDSSTETIYYINKGYELVLQKDAEGNVTNRIHRHHIWNGDDVVATYEKTDEQGLSDEEKDRSADKVSYYHRDIIGSGELITGSAMNVVSRRFFTPYGERVADVIQDETPTGQLDSDIIEADESTDIRLLIDETEGLDSNYTLLSEYMRNMATTQTHLRGYSSHEQVHEVGLINMNARLYDPVIGRFISADFMVPDMTRPLSYNRYMYAEGNPVIYRDPTGHFIGIAFMISLALFMVAYDTENVALQQISTVLLTVTGTVMLGAVGVFAEGIGGAMAASTITSLGVSYLSKGSITGGDVRNALIAGFSAGAANGIGAYMGEINSWKGWVNKAALQGTLQGSINYLRGDNFTNGMISGLIGSLAGSSMKSLGLGQGSEAYKVATRTFVSAGAAAITAKATGGIPLQAALTGGLVHLFGTEPKHVDTKNELHAHEPNAKQTTATWLKPKEHLHTVGRKGHSLVWDGTEARGVGSFIDDFLPAGHVFGANHDRFVDYATSDLGLPDALVNFPSMLILYPAAIIQEALNTPTGILNSITGNEHEVPLPHKSPYKR